MSIFSIACLSVGAMALLVAAYYFGKAAGIRKVTREFKPEIARIERELLRLKGEIEGRIAAAEGGESA